MVWHDTAMEEGDFISKTRRKRQMKDLQDVGAALVKLSTEQLARLDLPEPLRDAVLECKRFSKHEAVRRQMQYIGRIMREIDAGPIAEQLARLEAPGKRHTALFHVAEKWRAEILADPGAIARFVKEFPEADPHRLRELATDAREEQGASKPPRNYRELFHVLNAIVQDHARRHP
ncbi:MAG TPA: ribosome biogenesis factor YjgA [Usitatibacter sp.]|nr:ribosome biogenesis factor YjgA [Usitatibacter sp.]